MAGEELGAIEAAGFDADQYLAGSRGRDGDVFELEDFGAAGGVNYCCSHCHLGCHFRGCFRLLGSFYRERQIYKVWEAQGRYEGG